MTTLFNDIKEGKITEEQALYPERHIADFNPDDLKVRVMKSGFPSLDDYMFLKANESELIFVAGRPGMGKSSFMFQLAAQIAANDPVHVFSLEMSAKMVRTRMASIVANKPIEDIQKGRLTKHEKENLVCSLSGLNYFIDDRGGLNMHQIYDAARNTQKYRGTRAIVIDYLQFIRSERGHSTNAEVSAITYQLKQLAKDLKVPVIVGSQLSRKCEERGHATGNHRPLLSDLRDSGSIEQDADMVLMLYRQYYYTKERQGEADIIIAKNRNGPVGEVTLQYSEHQTKFIDEAL